MLREHYPTDKRFEEIVGYLPKMDPVLAKIDRYLEDGKLYRLIRTDLAKRSKAGMAAAAILNRK